MTTRRFTTMAALVAAALLFVGCKKGTNETATIDSPSVAEVATPTVTSEGMLWFASAEDFMETQRRVLEMGEAERIEWERKQGFMSYATKCEMIFEEFEANGINSDDDIYDFVNANSEYFYVREEDGEKYLTSYLEFSSYYHFVDANRILQIGNDLFKVFDEGVITAPISEKEKLLKVSSFYEPHQQSFRYFENNQTEFVSETKHEDGCDCKGKETVARKTNGNNRTYVRFYIDKVAILTGDPVIDAYYWEIDYFYNDYHMKIRPYHRILGIWYWCRRTISYNVNYSMASTNGMTHSGNKSGQDSGGKIDVILHRYTGNYKFASYGSITGYAATPDAYRILPCSTMDGWHE